MVGFVKKCERGSEWYEQNKKKVRLEMLKNHWSSNNLNIHTKIRIFKSNVLSAFLCASACLKTSADEEKKKLNVFQTKCLNRILKVFWTKNLQR